MEIQTTRFGTTKIDDEAIMTFTQPIIGFREFRRFVVLPGPPDSGVVWLQSTESPDLAFILMDPRDVAPSYTVELSEHERAELAVSTEDELDIYRNCRGLSRKRSDYGCPSLGGDRKIK